MDLTSHYHIFITYPLAQQCFPYRSIYITVSSYNNKTNKQNKLIVYYDINLNITTFVLPIMMMGK